jgi:hypothetical protein
LRLRGWDGAQALARIDDVGRALVGLALVVLLGLGSGPSPAAEVNELRAHGLRVFAPSGWQLTNQSFADCSAPVQALAITNADLGPRPAFRGSAALVLVLEDRGVNPPSAYPPRTRFRLPARSSQFESCCEQPTGPGYEFLFRDQGRDFYAFVYASKRPQAEEAVAILNTLKASRRTPE